ncbi:MAG: GNAT family N-acetyltransferase [Treponemataceae bacterium]
MYKILKAKQSDSQDILNIYNSANEVFDFMNKQNIIDTFSKMINTEHVYILIENKNKIGFISYDNKINFACISAVYVKFDKQRHGFGKMLLDFAENLIFNEENLNAIALKALKKCDCAVDFYKKNGYKPIVDCNNGNEIFSSYFPLNPWEVLMVKNK